MSHEQVLFGIERELSRQKTCSGWIGKHAQREKERKAYSCWRIRSENEGVLVR